MSWLAYWLSLALVVIAQTTVVRYFAIPHVPIDLFLILALACAVTMSVSDARLAAWFVGFAQDIESGGPIGVHAFCLGLAGLLLTLLRDAINLRTWRGRLVGGLAAALPAQLLLMLYIGLRGLGAVFIDAFIGAVVAAAAMTLITHVHVRRRPYGSRVVRR